MHVLEERMFVFTPRMRNSASARCMRHRHRERRPRRVDLHEHRVVVGRDDRRRRRRAAIEPDAETAPARRYA